MKFNIKKATSSLSEIKQRSPLGDKLRLSHPNYYLITT